MGKAIIQSNGGGGMYIVDEVYDNRFGAKMYNQLTAESIILVANRDTKISDRDLGIVKLDLLNIKLNDLISMGEDTTETVKELSEVGSEVGRLNTQINTLQINISSNDIQLAVLSPDSDIFIETVGWSADFSDSIPLLTEVGIVDRKRADQLKNFITIQPTFRNGSTNGYLWNAARDGVLQHRFGAPSTGWAYNYAMADGADTWLPRYVYADIVSINRNDDTGTVTIDDFFANSIMPYGLDSVLPINAKFEYMNCNSDAFVIGNGVVVDVGDENDFKIIGFQTSPIECIPRLYLIVNRPSLGVGTGGSGRGYSLTTCNGDAFQSPTIDMNKPLVNFVVNFIQSGIEGRISEIGDIGPINHIEFANTYSDIALGSFTESLPDDFLAPNGITNIFTQLESSPLQFYNTSKRGNQTGFCVEFTSFVAYKSNGSETPEHHILTVEAPFSITGATTGKNYEVLGFKEFTQFTNPPLAFRLREV